MTIGQRLKEARLAAGLSQRQLCGDTITRNMLSQIENGVARPSMDTLQILAKRLGRPVSFFLEENPDLLASARECFRLGDYAGALKALEGCQMGENQNEEYHLLKALSCLQLAEETVAQRRMPYAISLLEECAEAGEKTAYFVPILQRRRSVLLAQALPDEREQLVRNLPGDDLELLLRAQVALHRQESALAATILDAAWDKESGFWCMLRGRAAFQAEDYTGAAAFFHKAEQAGEKNAWGWLEQCYRLLEDYKMAYYYATKQK